MLFLGTVACFYFVSVNGQSTFGIKGGVSIANFSHNDHKPRISGHGGFFVNRVINKYISVQPELIFSGEGRRYTYASQERAHALYYIQIPLMLQVYPVADIFLEAGPQVGLLISAQDKKLDDGQHSNIKNDFSTAQFSLATGLGIKATEHIIIYARYNFGMTDITPSDQVIHHSNVAQVGIAFRLTTL